MEVQDGFIVGIYNYCDRWCETCRFTSRCGSFALVAEMAARTDASFREVTEEGAGDPARAVAMATTVVPFRLTVPESTAPLRQLIPAPYRHIEALAKGYACHALGWLQAEFGGAPAGPGGRSDPVEVLGRYALLVPGKVFRTLSGLACAAQPGETYDAMGSAKAALLALDASERAWCALIDGRRVTTDRVACFLADIRRLRSALEGLLPAARSFVRPGFDEPDMVAALEARERAGGG